MDEQLRRAISELLDEAEFAVKVLDRYSDYEDDNFDLQPGPNDALVSHTNLKKALERVDALLSANPKSALEASNENV